MIYADRCTTVKFAIDGWLPIIASVNNWEKPGCKMITGGDKNIPARFDLFTFNGVFALTWAKRYAKLTFRVGKLSISQNSAR